MKKIFSKLLLGGALLCGLSMSLTSCEGALDDILGEWSRPTPGGGSSNDETTPTMMATPLTLEVLTDGNITVTGPQAGMYYKKNGGDQVDLPADASIDVTKDDKVEFYGTAPSYFGTTFGGTAEVKVYGNIMSLLSPTGFADNKTLTAANTFNQLFVGYAKLKDASNLFLPAPTLTDWCYYEMFSGCSSLTTAPEELPATTLADNCYDEMFKGCTSLTTAPALPATTLADNCYYAMFQDCTSLTTAPKLPATTLKGYCYAFMFSGCSSLTTAPKLPATTLVNYCYIFMFNGCTSLTTAYVKAAYTTANNECFSMFMGCSASGDLYTDGATSGSPSWADASVVSAWTKHAYE